MRFHLLFLLVLSAVLLCRGQVDIQPADDHGDDHRGDDDNSRDDDDNSRDDDDNSRDDDSREDPTDPDDDDHGRHGCSNIHLTGRHDNLADSTGEFASPNFPNPYSTESFNCDYHIENEAGGHVRLVFDDFLLSRRDEVTIRYGDKRHHHSSDRGHRDSYTFKGDNRPFAIVSKGSSIWIEFSSKLSFCSATGFKATYEFVSSSYWAEEPTVYQSVASHRSSLFGYTHIHNHPQNIDYVWVLRGIEGQRVLTGIQHMFMNGQGDKKSLEIRDGLTSAGDLLGEIASTVDSSQPQYFISKSDAVYVRVRSEFHHNDQITGTFASATEQDDSGTCPTGYFHCKRGHCIIDNNVVCDGYNHCGDNSDEAQCNGDPTTSISTTTTTTQSPGPIKCDMCQNGGVCVFEDNGRSYCICQPGYYGNYCEHKEEDRFDCSLCHNNATCVPSLEICSCPDGFHGQYCEIPEEPIECDMCQNGGTCMTDDVGRSHCICDPGYYGDYCEYEEDRKCEGCENGGVCNDPYDGECTCPDGFYGLRCEHKEDPDDFYCGGCENDGECRSDGYCVCPEPYYGPHCEYYEPECGGGCLNGGECKDGVCHCDYGYYGHRCEYPQDYYELPYEDEESAMIIGIVALGGLIGLLVLLLSVCCCCRKKTPVKVTDKVVVKPYTINTELKYSVSMPPSYDDCHDNPTYDTVNPDNISLPPSYDDIGRCGNDPDVKDKKELERDVEKVVIKVKA